MSPEEIRNQCEDDADRAPSDLTVWRDRGAIIAAQQTRIIELEAQVARVEALAVEWESICDGRAHRDDLYSGSVVSLVREALS